MATAPETITFLMEQLAGAGQVTARKMFGEYGIYLDERMVGVVCDDQLFIKNFPQLHEMLADPVLAPPFPGAKPYLLIEAEVDDPELLSAVLRRARELAPEPKPKRKRK